MTVYANTSLHIASDELAVSCFANTCEVTMSAVELDRTTYCSGGWRQKILGLAEFTTMVSGFQDYTGPSPATIHPGTSIVDGDLTTFTVAIPGTTAGDTAFLGQCRHTAITELSGSVGDLAAFSFSGVGSSRLAKGGLLAPYDTETATGTGTVLEFTPPTATQALHAAFHVHDVQGSGSIQFVVATDDAAGFSGAVTRITSNSFTAVGHQFASLSGALTGETHIRLGWTISGFTSVTFSAAFGIGAP